MFLKLTNFFFALSRLSIKLLTNNVLLVSKIFYQVLKFQIKPKCRHASSTIQIATSYFELS